jgi:hypothetical protein
MRYHLKVGEDPRGLLVICEPSGGATADGSVLFDGPQRLIVEEGNSFEGYTWEQLVAAADQPGFIDVEWTG